MQWRDSYNMFFIHKDLNVLNISVQVFLQTLSKS